ncbi:hypothetical protein GGI12_003458, partial [Dipsacomyces acuminosporus]
PQEPTERPLGAQGFSRRRRRHERLDKSNGETHQQPASAYGGKRAGWLRITRSVGPSPLEAQDTGAKLSDIVARGFSKWVSNRRTQAKKPEVGAKAGAGGGSPANEASVDMYYAVLDKDTLVMYDSEQMNECRGVIIMSKHKVSLYHRPKATQSQVYSRRTPIRISPLDDSMHELDFTGNALVSEYYVFVDSATDKEDWYFALLWSSLSCLAEDTSDGSDNNGGNGVDATSTASATDNAAPLLAKTADESNCTDGSAAEKSKYSADEQTAKKLPEMTEEQKEQLRLRMRRSCLVPDRVGVTSILRNVSDRSGSEDGGKHSVREDEWLNAILGRLFLGVYQTEWARQYFIRKIQTKFDRVKRPAFLDDIRVTDLDIGDNFPVITNPRLESFDTVGQVDSSMYVLYKGGFRLVLTTGVKLGSIRMSIALSVVLESLAGKMLIRVKPAPSNRVWMGFYEMPSIRLSLSPVFMQKQVKYSLISQAIEKQIYDIIRLTLVLPNLDDTVFFPTDIRDAGIFESYLKEYKDLGLGDVQELAKPNADLASTSDGVADEQSRNGESTAEGSTLLDEEHHQHAEDAPSKLPTPQLTMQTPSVLTSGDESLRSSNSSLLRFKHQRTGSNASSESESSRSILRAPSPSTSKTNPTLTKAASIKSAISTSAVSLFKRAKDSQAAESAKVWWHNMHSNHSLSEVVQATPPGNGKGTGNSSSGARHSWHTTGRINASGISSDGIKPRHTIDPGEEIAEFPVHHQIASPVRAMLSSPIGCSSPLAAGVGIGASTLRHGGEAEGIELPLPHAHTASASLHTTAFSRSNGDTSNVATGTVVGAKFQFPKLGDGGSKHATALSGDASETNSGIRRRVGAANAVIDEQGTVELPIQRRYSKGRSGSGTSSSNPVGS